jgi:hypothetical protein
VEYQELAVKVFVFELFHLGQKTLELVVELVDSKKCLLVLCFNFRHFKLKNAFWNF